jgi:WD40 repeat protein
LPRRENPLGQEDDALTRFAGDLRALRERAGRPTYRQLSARAHYSAAALSEAASGRKFPSLAVTLAYVRACGGEPRAWEERWRALAAAQVDRAAGAAPPPAGGTAPYVGSAPFTTDDAALFSGRAALVTELVAAVRARRLVAVTGASGSGVTSVLRAGLVPALTAAPDRPRVVVLTPGPRPVEECAVRLADVVGMAPSALRAELAAAPENLHLRVRQAFADGHDELVVVVDELAELFTRCDDEAERTAFVTALVHAAATPTSRVRIVLGLRADLLPRCARYPGLADAVHDGEVRVGAMTADELRAAVTEPAAAAGCRVETALLVRLVADAAAPGTLPFLGQALLETWRRRRGTTLTLAAYEAAGGIPGLLTRAAEQAVTALDDRELRVAERLLLRLCAVDAATDASRRLRRDDLDPATAGVLDRLVAARVVVADRDRIELAGTCLDRNWPRLRSWLAGDPDRLRVQRELAEAAAAWDAHHRDRGALYRGVPLAAARELAGGDTALLTPRERAFLTASLATQSSERRRTRRVRSALAVFAVVLVLASAAVTHAVRADLSAARQRDVALAQTALREAAELRDQNPALAVQLTLAAYRLDPTPAARDRLLAAFARPYATRVTGHTEVVADVAVSGDGDLLATAGEDSLRLWDTADPHHPRDLSRMDTDAASVAMRGDGRLLVSGNRHGASLWDVGDPARPGLLGVLDNDPAAALPVQVALSADGRTLATTRGGTAELWDVADPAAPRLLRSLAGHASAVTAVAFSADGRTLATAAHDTTVRLWPVGGGTPVVLHGHTRPVNEVAFSPDGRTLVTTGDDEAVRLWDLAVPGRPTPLPPLTGHRGGVFGASFSADGRVLATVGGDRSTRLWDLSDRAWPRQTATLYGHEDMVAAVEFTRDGRTLVTAGFDFSVRLTDVAEVLAGRAAPATSLAYRADGAVLASAGDDGTVRLLDATDRHHPRPVGAVPVPGATVSAPATGRVLATGGPAALWDVADPARPRKVADVDRAAATAVLSRHGGLLVTAGHGEPRVWRVAALGPPRELATVPAAHVVHAAFGGDRLLATLGADLVLWDLADPARPARLAALPAEEWTTAAFRPDGKVLAALAADGGVWLWDVADTRAPRLLARRTAATGHGSGSGRLAFDGEGRTLATALDTTVRLWDVTDPASPRGTATLRGGHTQPVTALAFGPDGATLTTAGADGALHVWDTTPERVARRVCGTAHPRLGEREWRQRLPGLSRLELCP